MFFSKRFWGDKNLCADACAQSCPSLCNPMDCSLPGSLLSMAFSKQEYWSGFPFPPPGDLPNSGIKPTSLLSPPMAGRFFTTNVNQEVGGKNTKIFCFFSASILPQKDYLSVKFYHRRSFFLPDFTSETPSVRFYLRSSYCLSDFCLRTA